jgi:ribosome-binding factor A
MASRKAPSRRQEKVARIIKEAVSEIIRNQLNDPRVEGLVSVTDVDISPDLKTADVFLSILATTDTAARKTFTAIAHATGYIQTEVGSRMTSKYFPRLNFCEDKKVKKTLETLKLIDQAAEEIREKDAQRIDQEESENSNGDLE